VKKLLLLFFSLLTSSLWASHIVGGEFEILHISGSTYRVNLIYYFDTFSKNFQGTPPELQEKTLTARIFRKSDNAGMRNVVLTFVSPRTKVSYTQPACSSGEVVTDKLIYTAIIELPSDTYNDPDGYYIAWERCCRNYTITNIYSEEPSPGKSASKSAGQTFYLEFPAVTKNGQPFINSSPHLFPPLSDYACILRPYYVDFAGVDDDGDSLVYSLTTPLSTHTVDATPPLNPAPYPLITWRPGYGVNTITKGNPDFRISKAGMITVTPPATLGLFVFAIKVEEFRNKEKIGESRRDFQMLVVDCKEAFPPQIVGKKKTALTIYSDQMDVSFSNSVNDADRCIEVTISDPDASRVEEDFTEKINIRVVGLNFKSPELNKILPQIKSATLKNGSTATFNICLPRCPFVEGGPYKIGIIAMDDACSLPLLDTLKVNVTVEPPPNTAPYFTTAVSTSNQLNEGESRSWPFQIKDDDGDELVLFQLTDGFVMSDVGMKVKVINQVNGLINGELTWDAACDKYDFSKRTNFKITLIVEDQDECKLTNPVLAEYNLSIRLPGNADPIIDTNLTTDPMERVVDGIERKVFQSLSFKVTGSDLVDNDFVNLRMIPIDFKPSDFGITFPKTFAKGLAQSTFQWNMNCAKFDLKKKDLFEVMFIAVDSTNKCRIRKADTVNVKIKVLPPDNVGPLISVRSLNPELTLINNHMNVTLGQQIILGLEGSDADIFPQKDSIKLSLARANGDDKPEGYSFTDAKGVGLVASTFTWNPDCSIFENGVYENKYAFKFYLKDNRCIIPKADSVEVKITLKDVNGSTGNFIPVNFFTPNGDGKNDYYAMQVQDELTGEPINILPADNCAGHFEIIQIVNRWGNIVFESYDRNFRWYGKDEAAGVYYYHIKYSDREYKGALSLRY
jgi:hypothetical protein